MMFHAWKGEMHASHIGTAPSYYARGFAQNAAIDTARVVEVGNNIGMTSRS